MRKGLKDEAEVGKLLDQVASILSALPSPERTASQEPAEPQIPGFLELEVVAGGMDVVAHLYPPVGGGAPLSLEAVYGALSKAGVVHGILHSRISSTLVQLNTERRVLHGVVIARGTPAVDFIPEHWVLVAELLERRIRLDSEAMSLDPKEHSPFVMVNKGDLLAIRATPVAGSSGRDVFGKELPFRNGQKTLPRPGLHVVTSAGACLAECDGCFRWVDPVFQVDHVLVVHGVDYGTGHIDFAGDVVIQGEIARGFRIKAQGAIFSSQVIDASEVISGDDVVTTRGIIGRDGAVVQAQGRVRAKFLENITLRATGSIEVRSSAMNSVLLTLDKLTMGPKSLLMGGRVQAQNGIEAFQVGTDRGAYAELCCGMDFQALEKVIEARDQVMVLVKKLQEIDRQKRLHPSKRALLDEVYTKVRDEVARINELSKQWVRQIDRREEAQVVVHGTIFPGNSVEICHCSTVVAKPLSRVRFFLDKARGVVAWEPL